MKEQICGDCYQFSFDALSNTTEFKVEGGCKVKEYEQANQGYREIKVVMDDEHRIFEIRRSKRGGKMSS